MNVKRTWILIADGERARVLSATGRGDNFEKQPELLMSAEELPDQHVKSERPGRVHEAVGPMRHAIEPRTALRRQIESDFAKSIADRLTAKQDEFDALIVVAAPKTLGDLRHFLASSVVKKVCDEISKDLTNTPDKEIPELIKGHLKVSRLNR